MASKFLARYKFGANISVRRAFRAYKDGKYEAMFDSLKYVKPENFVQNKNEDLTILHHAALAGDMEGIDVLKELPYFSEIINDNTNTYEWTPILWAANKKNVTMLKKLNQLGGNILQGKKDGITCLHLAATNNDVHSLSYGLENRKSKSVDVENAEGWTPSHFAAFMGNYDSLSLLVDNDADLFHKNKHNMDVFEEITRSNDEKLLEGVYHAYKNRDRDLDKEGSFSLLHLAAGSDGFKVLEFLIAQGEDVKQIGNANDRATSLHFAVLSNNYMCAKMLLNAHASPNARDSTGHTPYHFAVSSKNRQMMQLLEESGGDATIENNQSISPLDYAAIENVKAAKLFFLSLPKYTKYIKENAYFE